MAAGNTTETGIYKSIRQKLKAIDNARIDVGYFPGDTEEDGTPIAAVALWNDKGVPGRIPERPFLSVIIDENRQKYSLLSKDFTVDALAGRRSVIESLSRLGNVIVGDVKEKITELRLPANARSTIAAKESANPLIDTGTMRNKTKFKVRNV